MERPTDFNPSIEEAAFKAIKFNIDKIKKVKDNFKINLFLQKNNLT